MKCLVTLLAGFLCLHSSAQLMDPGNPPGLMDHFDLMTEQWLSISSQLENYEGLGRFCDDAEYRSTTLSILNQVHHYDSILMSVILDPDRSIEISQKNEKKLLTDLHQLEGKYSTRSFIEHLKSNCLTYRELEREKDHLKGNSGMYSYDGQTLLVASDMQKYLKHIDKKIVSISEYLHLLNLQWVD